jgi:hypothetical protein
MAQSPKVPVLFRKEGRVFARFDGRGDGAPVKLVWAKPISGRGEEVALVGEDKKELVLLTSLDCLDQESRTIAEEELERRYMVPVIIRVYRTHPSYGNRYWAVETDRGWRSFVMKDPGKNVVWLTHDRLVLRDTMGNRYEIASLASLDDKSQAEVNKVL